MSAAAPHERPAMGPSRLDRNIRRLQGCRDCLNRAAEVVADLDGVVLEFGLGNGRTFDHLRRLFPERDIFVFERQVTAHPSCIPDAAHLFEGDVRATLPAAMPRLAGRVALIHADIGGADPEKNAALAAFIAGYVPELVVPGGLIVTSTPFPGLAPFPAPESVAAGSYFMHRPEPA